MPKKIGSEIASFLVGLTILFLCILVFPWNKIEWGKIEFSSPSTVTVSGQAKMQEQNQIATFSVSISAVNDDKETAVSEVNTKINEVVESVKAFGINDQDIQTERLYVSQRQESYVDDDEREKSRAGQWSASNTVSISLRDVDKANDLATLLSASTATSVSGPNFRLEDTKDQDVDLLASAIENARQKAGSIAKSSGKELGEVLHVTEGTSYSQPPTPLYPDRGIGAIEIALEPGSSTIQKSVIVVFELK